MPPGVQRSTASETFSRFLYRKHALGGIDFSPQGDAVSRLQLFNLAGMDYQGQVSSGYGHQGLRVNLGLKVNLFDFLFPMIPLPGLKPEVSLEVSGSGLQEHFVLIQRYPQALYKVHRSRNQQTGHYEWTSRLIWGTRAPLCLLGLEGVSGEVTVRAAIQAGVTIPFPSLGDELGIDVSAVAGASGALTGKFIRLRGAYSDSFPSPSDIDLGLQSRLDQVVAYLFSHADRPLLKEQIDGWITDMVTNWLQAKQPASPAPVAGQPGKREQMRAFGKRQLAKLPLGQISEGLQDLLNDYIFSLVNLEIRLPVFSSLLTNWQTQPSTGDLLRRLEQLSAKIRQLPEQAILPAERIAALRQIQSYVILLKKSYSRIDPRSVPGLLPADQSFLHLFSFVGGAKASAEATAGASLQTPTLPVANISIQASGGLGALASASVDVQRIAYRYQSRLDGGAFPLFFTQDTWITYRRTNASADAFVQVGLTPLGYEQRAARELAYQSMSYLSTALYWRHTTPYVVPEPGSGLRIGMSVAARRLIRYAREKAAGRSLAQIANPICQGLVVGNAQFDQLVAGADLGSLDENQEGFPKYLFLEAAFPFSEDMPIYLKESRPEPKSTGQGRMLQDRQLLSSRLQSLRLRIRISDIETTQTPLFKLGFPIIGSQITVDLSRVRGAGQEGMFDYYVHWFSNPTLNTDPAAALAAQETSVPPVVLLHQ
jgi:hypothetical protein